MLVVLLIAAVAQAADLTHRYTALDNGNWGQLILMNNRRKCYGLNMASHNRFGSNDCNSYDDKQLWRYDKNTHQLHNKGLSDIFGSPYCLAISSDDRFLYIRKCLGQIYNKFGIREDLGGTVQQFTIEMKSGYCIDLEGWSYNNDQRAILHPCEGVTRAKSDHWTVFQYHSRYTGHALQPVKQTQISDGHWGSITPRTTGSCFAVDSITHILEQRDCLSSDDGQKFRWDSATKELRNYRYPVNIGGRGCVTSHNNVYYIQQCVGSVTQKFIMESGVAYDGQFQMIRSLADPRYCIGVQGGSAQGYRKMYRYTCDKRMTSSNDQWLAFEYWRAAKECPGGQHLVGNKCQYCPANTYSEKGAAQCTACPAGYTSPRGAKKCTKVNNCPAGSFLAPNTDTCTLCPINTFTNKAHSTHCTACGAGYYTDKIGSTSCKNRVQCSPGSFVHGRHCWKCPVNSFSNTYNAAKCTKCPAGYVTDGPGATSCKSRVRCSPGSFKYSGKCWQCPVNTFSTAYDAPKCTNCPSGYITEGAGSTSCKKSIVCAAGTYIHKGGCWKCPKDTFSNTENAAKCTPCPHRYDTETTGSKTCKVKTYCKPGKYHNGHNCVDCPLNTYDNSVGNVRCKPCPAGQITTKVGSTSCTIANNCKAGSFYNTGTRRCVKCAKNTYSAEDGKTYCDQCPKGWETKEVGAVKCTKINFCKAGKFWNGKRCWNCPKNTYTNQIGSVECIPCGEGYETHGTGSIVCTKITSCDPGNFFNGKDCQACPINTFNNKHGAKWCTKCPKGYETKAIGALACTQIQCSPGSYFNSKQSKCNLCPMNTFNAKHGAKWCTKCPDGWKTNKIGSLSCVKIPICKPGKFYNGSKCQYCPINTFSNKAGAKFCTKCPPGYETKRIGRTACTKIPPKFNVVAVPQKKQITCPYNSGSPPCAMFCRFRTSTGIAIKNKANIRFYKKVGEDWVQHGKVFYNRETDWFNVKVATKPDAADAGLYKCEAKYGGKVGSAEMTVNLS